MGDKKIIAVVGATGAQGGSLVRAIVNDPSGGFSALAITRDINSGKAKELINKGVEVVAADIDDERSLEKALQGAYGAYFVTFYWEHLSPDNIINCYIFSLSRIMGLSRPCTSCNLFRHSLL